MRAEAALGLSLLLFVILYSTPSNALSRISVRIPVYERQYLKDIRVGSPGKRLTLRMRWDLDQTYLYESPRSYSETFTDWTPLTNTGSDLFFFRSDIEPVRLPVVYSQEPTQDTNKSAPYYNGARQDTSGGVSYQGSLGLGPNSPLWSIWTSYSISAFTLTFGRDDTLDTLRRGDMVTSTNQFFLSFIDTHNIDVSIPLEFKLSEEFTFLPLEIFTNVTTILDRGSKLSLMVEGNNVPSPGPRIDFWLSTKSSFVITALGGPEDTLRLSEQEGRNKSEIIVGRIQLLGNFVVFKDLVRNITRVRQVYDTFPSAANGQFPQAVIALFTVLLLCSWGLISTPSVYQWLVYGVLTHHKGSIVHLKKIVKIASTASPLAKKSSPPPQQQSEFISSEVSEREERIRQHRIEAAAADASGPVDWIMLRLLLFLSRLIAFWTFFVAVWGFHSGRFAARLSDLGGVGQDIGIVVFWFISVFELTLPFVVNVMFLRRYTQSGVLLVGASLGFALWINMLPATNTFSFIAFIRNMAISLVVGVIVFLWPMWCSMRGPDAAISDTVTRAKEFMPETAYVPDAVRQYQHVVGIQPELLPLHNNNNNGPSQYTSRWEPGEIIILSLWCLVLIPVVITWIVTLNVLPFLQSKLPHSIALQVSFSIMSVALVSYLAFAIAAKCCTQIHQEASVEYREQTLEVLRRASASKED